MDQSRIAKGLAPAAALALALTAGLHTGQLRADDAYIEGTGTQAMILDACPTTATRIECDFQFTTVWPQAKVWGLESTSDGQVSHFMLAGTGGKNFYFAGGDTWIGTTAYAADTARHTAIEDVPNKKIAILTGITTNWSATVTYASTRTSKRGIAVFGVNAAGWLRSYETVDGVYGKTFAKLRIYGLRMYANGKIIHNYRPWRAANGGKYTGLKDLCTGKIFVNQIDESQFVVSAGVTSDPAWDLPDAQPTVTPLTPPASGDWAVDVALNDILYLDNITLANQRLVKTGRGRLMLGDGNTFGRDVVISNGTLEADYETSGLAQTHLVVSGTSNSQLGFFSPRGKTFTAPVATSGAGTVECCGYCGFEAATDDLTLNLGGDARTLTKGQDGFNPSEFDIGHSYDNTVTLLNNISHPSWSFALKSSTTADHKAGIVKGTVSGGNSTYFNTYDGRLTFIGEDGRSDITGYRATFYNGTLYFTNVTFDLSNDINMGGSFQWGALNCTTKDCTRINRGGWDYFCGLAGSRWTMDNCDWTAHWRFLFGNASGNPPTAYQFTGTLVLTNNTRLTVGTFRQQTGVTEQYDSTLSATLATDTGTFRIGGAVNADVKTAQCQDTVYNLHSGSIYLRDDLDMQIGSTHKGTLNQEGGEVSANRWVVLGWAKDSHGVYNLKGGTFVRRDATHADSQDMLVGEAGEGVLSVSGGGQFSGCATIGVKVASTSTSKGDVRLSPEGTATVNRVFGGVGASVVTFNGGTLRARPESTYANLIDTTVKTLRMTEEGGAIDTNGKDAISLAKPFGRVASSALTGEAMMRQWLFTDGTLVDRVDGAAATTVGTTSFTDEGLALVGGKTGSSQVKLGTDLLPTDGRGWTYEMWFKLTNTANNFARLVEWGLQKDANKVIFISANKGSGGKTAWYSNFGGGENRTPTFVLPKDRWMHLGVAIENVNARWQMRVSFRDAKTGELLSSLTHLAQTDWTPSKVLQSEGLWIGNGAWGDPDPALVCAAVQIHDYAKNVCQLAANATRFGNTAFVKRGAGTLTLIGANAYPCPTTVEAGTLALASGATLPQTATTVDAGATLDLGGATLTTPLLAGAGTVKNGSVNVTGEIHPGGDGTVGTLTLDGVALTGGTLVADVTSQAADALVTTTTLDLSKIDLVVKGEAKAAKRIPYALVSGPVTGTFKSVTLPRGWLIDVSGNGVTLSRSGCVVILR